MEYPRMVFKSASQHLSVADDAERQDALQHGWFNSVPEALKGEHSAPIDHSVSVFKVTGGRVESFKASNQDEADMFIQADGWHATAAAATAADIRAGWPATPADVEAIMGLLRVKKKTEVFEYAARIGVAVATDAKLSDALAAIEARLKEPAA